MKYKTAKVISHPRAGSHYFTKLLNDNFFHKKDYLELYAGHSNHHVTHLKSPSTAVFYIYRNNVDTLKSIFRMRDRFGIAPGSWGEFLNTPLNELNSTKIVSEAVFNNGEKQKIVTEVDHYLGTHPHKVESFLNLHKVHWIKFIEQPNFMIVSYDHLKEDFQEEMLKVAKFLGTDKTDFTQEKERIGWYDKSEREKNFS